MMSDEGNRVARVVVPEPEVRGDFLQGLHARRTAALRSAGERLRSDGSKSRGLNSTHPQSPTPELHEIAERPDRPAH